MAVSINPQVSGGGFQGAPESVANSAIAVMVNGDTIFTVVGDIQIIQLFSECVTANNATASTLQYSVTPTGLIASTISGASSTLASAIIGTTVALDGTALSTAPIVSPNAVALGTVRPIVCLGGVIKLVIGVGSTTGTWEHYIRYRPLEFGAYVY